MMQKGTVLKAAFAIFLIGLAVYVGFKMRSPDSTKPLETLPPVEAPRPVSYKISGTIFDHNKSPLEGVGVVFGYAGGLLGKTTTNENGHYSRDNFSSGTYTVTASRSGFVTQSQTVIVTVSDIAADFGLTVMNYDLSGTVTAADGSILPEATVTLDGPPSQTATDGEGRYYFTALLPKTYALTISKPGYVSETKNIDIVDSNISIDIMLQPIICAISGTITAVDGTPLSGARIEWNGPKYVETATDDNGYYSAGEFPYGAYVMTVSKEGYVSEARPMDMADADTVADFSLAAQIHTMWGIVFASDGTALSGAVIEINGPLWNQTAARNTGDYYFNGLLPGTYTATAAKPGYIDQSAAIEISNQDVQYDFVLSPKTYTISGIVASLDGTPLSDVKLEFNGSILVETVTDYSGRYSKGELPAGTYVITASREGFISRSQTVVIADLDMALDFVLNIPAPQ